MNTALQALAAVTAAACAAAYAGEGDGGGRGASPAETPSWDFALAAYPTVVRGGERDIQRGPFAQMSRGPFTLGGYWFNPGSGDQLFVGLLGVSF
jgi:hypothetical protein